MHILKWVCVFCIFILETALNQYSINFIAAIFNGGTNNNNIDIKCSVHDMCHQVKNLKIGKPNNLKVFGSKTTKGPKQDSQIRSTLSGGGEPKFLVFSNS